MVKVVVYSKTYCPFCCRVKSLFEKKLGKENFKVIELDSEPNDEKFEKLKEKTKCKTVPQVFINNEFKGGCEDIFELETSGELDKLLKS